MSASMGPRPFRRGNSLGPLHLPDKLGSLQWGHVLSDVETTVWPSTWKMGGRFNGATSFQTWKRRGVVAGPLVAGHASMGPRPFRRGNAEE